MFFIAVLDFIGRVFFLCLSVAWAITVEFCKLLAAPVRAVVIVIRARHAYKKLRAEMAGLSQWYIDREEEIPFTDDDIEALVAEADLLIHEGNQQIPYVTRYLGDKYGIEPELLFPVIMAAEAYYLSTRLENRTA